MSNYQGSLAHLNWLCWLEETDYDVWLILLSYIQPMIDMRKTFKEIKYPDNPIFQKVMKRLHKDSVYYTRGQVVPRENICHFSISYLRWYQGHLSVACPYQIREFFKTNADDLKIYGIRCTHNSYDGPRTFNCKVRDEKDVVIEKMKINEIPYKKSWTKQKLLKTIIKHPIVD